MSPRICENFIVDYVVKFSVNINNINKFCVNIKVLQLLNFKWDLLKLLISDIILKFYHTLLFIL